MCRIPYARDHVSICSISFLYISLNCQFRNAREREGLEAKWAVKKYTEKIARKREKCHWIKLNVCLRSIRLIPSWLEESLWQPQEPGKIDEMRIHFENVVFVCLLQMHFFLFLFPFYLLYARIYISRCVHSIFRCVFVIAGQIYSPIHTTFAKKVTFISVTSRSQASSMRFNIKSHIQTESIFILYAVGSSSLLLSLSLSFFFIFPFISGVWYSFIQLEWFVNNCIEHTHGYG